MQNFHRTMEEQTQANVRALERARARQAAQGSGGSGSSSGGPKVLSGIIGLVAGIWIFAQLYATPVGALICAVIGGVIVSVIARIVLVNFVWVVVLGGGLLFWHYWH